MTRRQIDQSREIRLWFSQIVIPASMLVATTMAIPEVRTAVATKARAITEKLKRKEKESY